MRAMVVPASPEYFLLSPADISLRGLLECPILCASNLELPISKTPMKLCPIKRDLAEVSLTRGLLGINILSVVLK